MPLTGETINQRSSYRRGLLPPLLIAAALLISPAAFLVCLLGAGNAGVPIGAGALRGEASPARPWHDQYPQGFSELKLAAAGLSAPANQVHYLRGWVLRLHGRTFSLIWFDDRRAWARFLDPRRAPR
jgi:hypothetical protein